MSMASVDSRDPLNLEIEFRSPDQQKALVLEESDEHKLLGELAHFVEKSDQSIPRIAALIFLQLFCASQSIAAGT